MKEERHNFLIYSSFLRFHRLFPFSQGLQMEHRLKIMLLLLFAVFSLTIGNPLTVEENDELQKDCGKTYMSK